MSSTSRLAVGVRWIVFLILLVTPFCFTWVNEELFEFPKMLLVYGLTAIALTVAVIDHAWRSDWQRPKTKFDWVIAAFVGSQVLATIFSIHPRTSWLGYYTRFNGGLLSTLTYVSLYYLVVTYFSPRQLVKVSKILIVVGVLAAAYALPEHFGHSPSCLLIAKEFSVDCWVQDVKSRVFGTFGQPNWLAAYLITLLPLCLAWLNLEKNRWQKILWGMIWLGMFSVVLFTKSRSGLLGLATSLGVLAGLHIWRMVWQRLAFKVTAQKISQWSWLIGLAVITVVILVDVGTPFFPSLFGSKGVGVPTTAATKPAGTALETGGTESGTIRKIVWSGALAVWRRYPIFGSGVETFAYSYYQDRPTAHNAISEWDFLYNKAHNELLNYLATTGAVGLITYLAVWITLGGWVLIWLRQPATSEAQTQHQTLAIAWVTGLSAQFVSNFFGFSTVMINVLFWVGLASLAQWLRVPGAPAKTAASQPTLQTNRPWFSYLIIPIVGIAGILFMLQISRWWIADRDYTLSKALFQAGRYQLALDQLEAAIGQSPNEALFWDELANKYSVLATGLHATPQASQSAEVIAQLAESAVAASDQALLLNPRHLDFYKTRSQIFTNLAQIDVSYLDKAAATLTAARALSPTDPKLVYRLGLVEFAKGQTETGLADLKLAVTMKPDYVAAWFDLAQTYEQASQSAQARQVYQHILTDLAPDNPDAIARLKALDFIKNSP